MSRKKRQTVTLLVLCLVLIAAGVGYYVLIRHQAAQEKAEKAKESAKELFQLSSDDINNDSARLMCSVRRIIQFC